MEKRRGRVCAVEITHRYRTEFMHVAVECVSEKKYPGGGRGGGGARSAVVQLAMRFIVVSIKHDERTATKSAKTIVDNATPRTDAGQRDGVAVCDLQMMCAVRLNTARPHTACRSVRRRQVCQEGLAALQQLKGLQTRSSSGARNDGTPPGRRLHVFIY